MHDFKSLLIENASTHTHSQRWRERESDCQGHTPPLSFLHVVGVAVLDEQLIKENSLERTAGLSLTLYKFTIVCCNTTDMITYLQPF